MSEIKDSIALGDENTIKVHQGLCMYLKLLSEKEGKKIELLVRGLTDVTQTEIDSKQEYRDKYGISL